MNQKQSTTLFAHHYQFKLSEECSQSEDKKAQLGRKISLQKETNEGTVVDEIALLSKEDTFNETKQDVERIQIQAIDDAHQTKEIKETVAIEPLPSTFKEDLPVSEKANVDKTQKHSFTYSHVEAARMEKSLPIEENISKYEEKVETEVESLFPITISKDEEEKVETFDSDLPKKNIVTPTTTSRKTSKTEVISIILTNSSSSYHYYDSYEKYAINTDLSFL